MKKILLFLSLLLLMPSLTRAAETTDVWDFKVGKNTIKSGMELKMTTSSATGKWTFVYTGASSTQNDGSAGPRFGSKDFPLETATLSISGSNISDKAVISKVSFTVKGNAGTSASKWNLKVGGQIVGQANEIQGSTPISMTWDNLSVVGNDIVLELAEAATAGLHLQKVEITYDNEGGSVEPSEPKDYAAPFAGQAYTLTEGESIALPMGDAYPLNINYEGGNNYVAIANNTITAIAETTEPQTITASWEADETWNAGSASFTVTVNAKAPEKTTLATPTITESDAAFEITGDEVNGTLVFSHTQAGAEDKWQIYTAPVVKYTAPGEYTFKAKVEANDDTKYNNSEIAEKAYTVTAPVEPGTDTVYHLVTDINELKDGDTVIIAAYGSYQSVDYSCAMSNKEKTNNRPAINVTVADNKISSSDSELAVLTLGITEDNSYTFKLGDKYLASGTTQKKNYLNLIDGIADRSKASLMIDATKSYQAEIKFKDSTQDRNIIRYNPNKGSTDGPIFSCYSGGQQPVYLFKKVVNEPEPEVITAENISEALDLGALQEEGEDYVFEIAAPLHKFAANGTTIYVTDNKGSKGTRIDNVPAEMKHDNVLNNVRVKYVADENAPHFAYVSHVESEEAAAPAFAEMTLDKVLEDKAALMHNYVKIPNIYYDVETHTANVLTTAHPDHLINGMKKAEGVKGHPDAAYAMEVDDHSNISQNGFTNLYGYVEHNGTEPRFIVTNYDDIVTSLNTVEADADVRVEGGVIIAPEGSEVFTINGFRVNASAKQSAGIYVVRTADGKALKIAVK